MASDPRAVPLRAISDSDDDVGVSEGARLGAPPPSWYEFGLTRDDAPDPLERRGRRGGGWRVFRAVFSLVVVAGFAGVLWYAYQWGLGGGETFELPILRAEKGPEKVKPEDPGGLDVPYQDQLVLNHEGEGSEATRVERLLPPPETPLPPPTPGASEAEALPQAPAGGEAMPAEGVTLDIATAGAEPAAEAAEAPVAEETPTTVVEAPQPAEPKPEAAASAAGQVQSAQAVGGFALQLASLKSPDAAQQAWLRMQGQFPDLLTGLSLIVETAEVEGVGQVYRLQTGPFETRASASALCTKLKARQQDCFVVGR